MSISVQASFFVLRLPTISDSTEFKFVEYKIPSLLLGLFAAPVFGLGAQLSQSSEHGASVIDIYTIFDENNLSMRDLLQYLLHPHHFPICLENYKNLYRLAQNYQILSLIAEIIAFMKKNIEVP